MKKTKEYADAILAIYVCENKDSAILKSKEVAEQLLVEADEISKKRGSTSYAALLSSLKEQNTRWLSICKHVNSEINMLDPFYFINKIKSEMTMLYPNLEKIL